MSAQLSSLVLATHDAALFTVYCDHPRCGWSAVHWQGFGHLHVAKS